MNDLQMNENDKFDFDSDADLFNDILRGLENLFNSCNLKKYDREYRLKFSKSYQELF